MHVFCQKMLLCESITSDRYSPSDVGSMLGHRLRSWPSIEPASDGLYLPDVILSHICIFDRASKSNKINNLLFYTNYVVGVVGFLDTAHFILARQTDRQMFY